MDTLLTCLASISAEPFDCILHLGAGADADSADYSVLDPKHIVLIEADPESHTALAERFKADPHVTVINALVAPEKGDTAFHRFTLPSFNSPLGLGRLRELYPRIDLVEELRLNSQCLHEVIRDNVLGARNLLIFDIPGQEAAVLRGLPFEFLERFNSMVVLAGAESWQEGAEPLEATLATLKEKNFELVREVSEDPAWPVILSQRDEAKVKLQEELDRNARLFVSKATQIHQQTEKIAELEKKLASMAATCREAETEKARVLRKLSAAEKSTKSAAKKRALAASERKKADHARRKQLEALIAERDALASRLSTLEAEHSDLDTRHSSLVTALEELRGQHSSLSILHSSLIAERDDLVTRHSSLATALDELQGHHSSLDTRLSTLATEHSSLVAERDELLTQRDSLAQERDALSDRVASLEAEHATLTSERSTLTAEHSDLVTRHSSLATALEELRSQHSSLIAERDATEAAKAALEDQLAAATAEHNALKAENAALHDEFENYAGRLSEIELALQDRNRRTAILHNNVHRAEGQLKLLKDLLTRSA